MVEYPASYKSQNDAASNAVTYPSSYKSHKDSTSNALSGSGSGSDINKNASNGNSFEKQRLLDKIKLEIQLELEKVRNFTPRVGVFGDTGVGKSSLCNALFGRDVAKISDVAACTRNPQEIFIKNENGGGISLIDVPGVGEDPERHKEYVELYRSLLPNLDMVIWAMKADDRKYLSSVEVYNDILKPNIENVPVVFAITQADKIEPYREWDTANNKPGHTQLNNLMARISDVSAKFDVPTSKIIPVSSTDKWNLVELVNKIVEVMPNGKKYSITRESVKEVVSETAVNLAMKGMLDHLKDFAYKTYEVAKEVVLDKVTEIVPIVTAVIVDKVKNDGMKWLSSFGNSVLSIFKNK